MNLIGATADDARDIMIEGESGILAICPRHERPRYLPSKRRLEWPNGARSLIFTADEPERLRGKQHMKLWCDELCAWRHPEAFEQAMLGLRLGPLPQVVITTTPRPIRLLRELIADTGTVTTRGSTYDNRAHLSTGFFSRIISRYEGTRLGRQELNAEVLEDVEGALWSNALIEAARVRKAPEETVTENHGKGCSNSAALSELPRAAAKVACIAGYGGKVASPLSESPSGRIV